MMKPSELQDYLHTHIPLSAAMQVEVAEVSGEHVLLLAPLAPNINHRETVFGAAPRPFAFWPLGRSYMCDCVTAVS